MRDIVFSKYANERARCFALRTDIVQGDNRERQVIKSACYPQGREHIGNILKWQKALEAQFAQTALKINRAEREEDGSVCLEYLTGENLEQFLYRLLQEGKREEAFAILQSYLELIRNAAAQPFRPTPEFAEVFGEISLSGELLCMAVTDLDMVLENVVLAGEERVWTLIDYEWTFDFPIPVNFVLYRIWSYFLDRCLPQEGELLLFYCRQEGMTAAEMTAYANMERAFQRYVTGEHTPLREMFAQITPGCTSLASFGIGNTQSGMSGFRSTLSLQEEEKEGKWRAHSLLIPKEDGSFSVTFDLTGAREILKGCSELRWDPLEGQLCRMRIEALSSNVPLKIRALNAFTEGETEVFWTRDPVYVISGAMSRAQKILIRGSLEILDTEELLPEMVQTRLQRDACQAELEKVREELAALKSTKGFKVLEKGRSVRNYFSVRAKGKAAWAKRTFVDKNAYQNWYLAHRASEETLAQQRKIQPACSPKISILVPTYRTPAGFLREMIDSVLAQTYQNWQLCIADGGSGKEILDILEEYASKDSRIVYRVLEDNRGISENTNGAAALADGEFVTFLDHDDVLAPDALFEVAFALQDGQTKIVYTDEDKLSMDGKEHFDPHFKPDFSPDLLRSHNYITHLCVIEKAIFDQVGGFRPAFDGAQDFDLILRCTERTKAIRHVPRVLYHWRMHKDSTAQNPESKLYAYEAGRRAIEEHLQRLGLEGTVEQMKLWAMNHVTYSTGENPLVSVIIPNKDHVSDLDKCLRSILEHSTYQNLEIVVVENNSREPETFAYYEKIQKQDQRVRVVVWEREFNYSAINNFGVSQAKGDYLLLLNNDTELMAPDAIAQMLGCCRRKDVGCVGAKLLYGDDTVQHAGIVLGFGGFGGHIFHGFAKDDPGYMGRAQIMGNFSAVTAACMMVRREVYLEVGGFGEEFAVALNDVDFCMRLREKGYLIIMNPFALWHHYESKSRGYEDTPEKQERFQREIKKFRDYWGETVDQGDPYYNPNFSVNAAPFTLI